MDTQSEDQIRRNDAPRDQAAQNIDHRTVASNTVDQRTMLMPRTSAHRAPIASSSAHQGRARRPAARSSRKEIFQPMATNNKREKAVLRHEIKETYKYLRQLTTKLDKLSGGREKAEPGSKLLLPSFESLRSIFGRTSEETYAEESELLGKQEQAAMTLQSPPGTQEMRMEEELNIAFRRLTSEVSASNPDSYIMKELERMFSKAYEDWAMDHATSQLGTPDQVETELLAGGLLWKDDDVSPHLLFDITNCNASAIVLQACLSKFICRTFLMDPYFLIRFGANKQLKQTLHDSTAFHLIEQSQEPQKAAEWRAGTIEALQHLCPLTSIDFSVPAAHFCRGHSHMLKAADEPVVQQLAEILQGFAHISLAMWRMGRTVDFGSLTYFRRGRRDGRFDSTSQDMKPDPTVSKAARGSRLNGRPICVVVTPLIRARLPGAGTEPGEGIVWSKATVWVSDLEAPLPLRPDHAHCQPTSH